MLGQLGDQRTAELLAQKNKAERTPLDITDNEAFLGIAKKLKYAATCQKVLAQRGRIRLLDEGEAKTTTLSLEAWSNKDQTRL